MSAPLTELAIILALILANGLFAMSEIAVVSARKSSLRAAAEAGDKKAQVALRLAESPNRFLSTIQIGITVIGTMAGAFGGASLARYISGWLDNYPPLAPYSTSISLGLVVLFISYLSLVIGELVPKRIALNNPETIAAAIAGPMQRLSKLMSPLVNVLSLSTEVVLRLLGQSKKRPLPISDEEIRSMIADSGQTGMLPASERAILERVFQLGDRRAWAVMKPRPEIVWLDVEDPPEKSWEKIISSGYSQYPVCRKELDSLLGIVYLRDFLKAAHAGQDLNLLDNLRQPLIVPESKPALEILDMFKKTGSHMTIVVNEFGGIEGLITLGDILEALVGYISTTDQPGEPEAVQREDGSWLFDGTLPIDEFKQYLDLKTLPGEELGHYQTLGGFVMTQLGRIPTTGDKTEWDGLRFEVVDMDGRRVDKVLVSASRRREEEDTLDSVDF